MSVLKTSDRIFISFLDGSGQSQWTNDGSNLRVGIIFCKVLTNKLYIYATDVYNNTLPTM